MSYQENFHGLLEVLGGVVKVTTAGGGILFVSLSSARGNSAQEAARQAIIPTNTPEAQRYIESILSQTPGITGTPFVVVESTPSDTPTALEPTDTPFVVTPTPLRLTPVPTFVIIETPRPTATSEPTPEIVSGPRPDWEQRLGVLINGLRTDTQNEYPDVPALSVHPALTTASQSYAEFLSKNVDPFSGLAHDADGKSPTQRVQEAGYRGVAAEILNAAYTTPDDMMEGFEGSPAHLDIMLSTLAKDIGPGCYQSPYVYTYPDGNKITLAMITCVVDFGYGES